MKLLCVVSFLILGISGSASAKDEVLSYGGKNLKLDDFPITVQQKISEMRLQHFEQVKAVIQDAAIDLYIAEQAKKQKKPESALRAKLLNAKSPSEKDLKDFYEKNKSRIPYPYDSIKGEIRKMLVTESENKGKVKLLQKIEKEKGARVLVSKPKFPKVDLKVGGFYEKGSPKAKVQIVEFADYQCPHCKHAAETFKKITKEFGNKIHYVFVDFPINSSGISRLVAEGAYCAHQQGKYWDYHYKAFEKQRSLTDKSPSELAKEVKLDMAKFKKCFDSDAPQNQVNRGRAEGERVGVSGTPGIYINGRKAYIGHDVTSVRNAIKDAMAESRS